MSLILSPGVYIREQNLTAQATGAGEYLPVFIGTANKGPLDTPVFISSPDRYVEVFGEPFPESYLGYSVLTFFEEGSSCYVVRVGVKSAEGQDAELAAVAIDTSGAKHAGWGRLPLFSGIDYGRINLRAISTSSPLRFHPASVTAVDYNDANDSSTHGGTTATLQINGVYTDPIDDTITLLITSAPDLTANSAISGAGYEVIRSSDGAILSTGNLTEAIINQSQSISLGNGLSVIVKVTDGVLDVNDTFVFSVVPDNRKFKFSVEGVDGSQYTMPSVNYTSAATFIDDFNALLSNEGYIAVSSTLPDGSVVPQIRTTSSGRWVQLIGTAGWANAVGQSVYAYDIPRGHLFATADEPYKITTQNNKIVLKVIGGTTAKTLSFTISTGLNINSSQLASSIDANGTLAGTKYFESIAITIPGGSSRLVILTTLNNQLDTLQLMSSFSNIKTQKFAQETGILYPYKSGYRGFSDGRVILPAGSNDDATIPASCSNPGSNECAEDSAYYENIVGWLVAPSAGTWINKYTIGIDVYTDGLGNVAGRYVITVKDDNGQIVDQVKDVSFDKNNARYIGNLVNPKSKFGGINGNQYYNWEPRPPYLNYDSSTSDYVVRQPSLFSSHAFSGGQNGIPTDAAYSAELDSAVIGTPAESTGMFSIQNSDAYSIDAIATPGFSSGAVIGQGLQLCQSRGSTIYIVDTPFGLRPEQAVDWHNGMLSSDLAQAINSSYGSLYHSWQQILDPYSRKYIWVPPSGYVLGVFARTARLGSNIPAGLRRGRLLTSVDVEYVPSLPERDLMYGNDNAINPIMKFKKDGIVIYGQKTLDRSDSAFNRVNVRWLVNQMKTAIVDVLKNFQFEPNDSVLWSQVKNVLDSYMGGLQGDRKIGAFKVIVDQSNNTDERVSQNQLWVTVFFQPKFVAEAIIVNLVALRAGASFSSQEALAAGGIVTAGVTS